MAQKRPWLIGLCLTILMAVGCTEKSVDTKSQPLTPQLGPEVSPTPNHQKPTDPQNPPVMGPTPSPSPTPPLTVARIFCETSDLESPWITTLTSIVSERFIPTTLTFSTTDGQKPQWESYWPLTSDGTNATALALGFTSQRYEARTLYSIQLDLPARAGEATPVRTIPAFPFADHPMMSSLGLKADWLAVDDTHSLAIHPSQDGKKFELLDISEAATLRELSVSPQEWFTPSLASFGTWAVFTNRTNPQLEIMLYDLNTHEKRLFPRARGTHQINPQFWGHRFLVWLEQNDKGTSLLAFDTHSNRELLVWETSKKLSPHFSIGAYQDVDIYLLEENIDSTRQFFNGGFLHVISLSFSDFRFLNERHIPLPSDLLGLNLKYQTRLFNSLFYLPWTHELILGKGNMGGLIRYLPLDNKFNHFGYQDLAFKCLRPRWIYEFSGYEGGF